MDESTSITGTDDSHPEQHDVQTFGSLSINRIKRQVRWGERALHLTPSEYRLISTLAAHPHRAFSSRELLEAMWESEWQTDTAPLQIHVSRLRKKLSAAGVDRAYLVTVHGFGYRFDPGDGLRDSEARANDERVVLEEWTTTSPIYVVCAVDRSILWVGANIERHLGWKPHEVVGRSIYSMVHPDDMVVAFRIRAELDAGKDVDFVGRVATVAGGFDVAQCRVKPIQDVSGINQLLLIEWSAPHWGSDDGDLAHNLKLSDISALPSTSEGVIELFFDRDLILREVRPHEPFLGYVPEEVIGAYFSPTGLTRDQVRQTIDVLLESGEITVDWSTLLFDAAGGGHLMRVVTRLFVGDSKDFLGMHSTIYLSDHGSESSTLR